MHLLVAVVTTLTLTVNQCLFALGAYEAGGSHELVEHFVEVVVPCESGWDTDPDGYFLGLLQFHPGTWDTVSEETELDDYKNPYHQGYNGVEWVGMIDEPGSSAGWPHCWW